VPGTDHKGHDFEPINRRETGVCCVPAPNAGALYALYSGFVLKFIKSKIGGDVESPYDAEDLAQDVWIRVLKHPPDSVTKPWLRTVAGNVCKNYLRRRELERKYIEPIPEPGDDDDPDEFAVWEPSISSEEERILASVDLDRLPDTIRWVLELRYVQDLSFKQIAVKLKCTENAARKKVYANLEKARHFLSD